MNRFHQMRIGHRASASRNAITVVVALLAICFTADGLAQTFDPGGLNLLKVKPLAGRGQKPDDVAVAVWPSGIIDAGQKHYCAGPTKLK